MKHIAYLLQKHLVLPVFGLGIVGGFGLTAIGIYNIIAGNDTSGEFTYGIPLLTGSLLVVFLIAKYAHRKNDESITDYLFSAIFWSL